MPPSGQSFTALNSTSSESTLPECMDYFTLSAPPNTDLWRKPPSQDTCTSPILYTRLNHPFVAAEVTVSADWEMEWDQGGLVIFAGRPPSPPPPPRPTRTTTTQPQPTTSPLQSSPPAPSTDPPPPYPHPPSPSPSHLPAAKWVKAGLEFCNGQPHASSVSASSDGADWAMSPLPPTSSQTTPSSSTASPPRNAYQPNYSSLRIKLERIGHALWIWFAADPPPYRPGTDYDYDEGDGDDVLGDWRLCGGRGGGGGVAGGGGVGGWKKLREVTWFFWGVDDKCVRVGVYASRPANFGVSQYARVHGGEGEGEGRGLEVECEGLEIF